MFKMPEIESDPRVHPDMTHCLKCGFFLSERTSHGIFNKHCLRCGTIYILGGCPDPDWAPGPIRQPEPLTPTQLRRLQRINARAYRARRGDLVSIEVIE